MHCLNQRPITVIDYDEHVVNVFDGASIVSI